MTLKRVQVTIPVEHYEHLKVVARAQRVLDGRVHRAGDVVRMLVAQNYREGQAAVDAGQEVQPVEFPGDVKVPVVAPVDDGEEL